MKKRIKSFNLASQMYWRFISTNKRFLSVNEKFYWAVQNASPTSMRYGYQGLRSGLHRFWYI